MRLPPEGTTSALTDPLQWIVLIGYGLAIVVLAGLAIGVGLVVAIVRGSVSPASERSGRRASAPVALLQRGEAESASAGYEQVEHRPAQTQATRLAREAGDHLRPPLGLPRRGRLGRRPRRWRRRARTRSPAG